MLPCVWRSSQVKSSEREPRGFIIPLTRFHAGGPCRPHTRPRSTHFATGYVTADDTQHSIQIDVHVLAASPPPCSAGLTTWCGRGGPYRAARPEPKVIRSVRYSPVRKAPPGRGRLVSHARAAEVRRGASA